jgi:hypothetical protein
MTGLTYFYNRPAIPRHGPKSPMEREYFFGLFFMVQLF